MTAGRATSKVRTERSTPPQRLFPAHLVRADVRDFAGYSSARTSDDGPPATIWLNANEAASASAVDPEGAHRRYPDPQPAELVEALAQTYAVCPDRVVVGRGSDEAIDLLVRTLCRPGSSDAVVQSSPTFGMYAVSARLQAVPVVDVPQREIEQRWEVDVAAVADAARDAGARLVFLASPGNPTGAVVTLEQLADLADALADTAVVVIDEAYQEFASTPSATTLLPEHANLVVLRTLSKAHGLAGVRVGTALCHPDLATVLRRVQAPYPIPAPVTELAVSALSPSTRRSVSARVAQTRAGRERLAELLGADPRVGSVCDSEANFLLVRSLEVDALLTVLRGSGIVVRDMRHLLENAFRVTVGSPEEIDAVELALHRPAARAPTTSVQPPTDQLHDIPHPTQPTITPARGTDS